MPPLLLVGGSNGRFRLDATVAAELAGQLAAMMREDRVSVAVTPSGSSVTAPSGTSRQMAPGSTSAVRIVSLSSDARPSEAQSIGAVTITIRTAACATTTR